MSKHLSLSERVMIERGLLLGNSFKVIGRMIGRSPTTTSTEVRKRRTFVLRNAHKGNDCIHYHGCLRKNRVRMKPFTPASTVASYAPNMIAVNTAKPMNRPIARNWRSRRMSAMDAIMKKAAKRATHITPHTKHGLPM